MTGRPEAVDPRGRLFMAGVMSFGASATMAYWVIWFGVNRAWLAADTSAAYLAFEQAFPLADAWLTLVCALAARSLFRRRASALLWMCCAGSASVFLALVDILFNLESGLYRARPGSGGAATIELVINVLTLTLGTAAVAWAWRGRREILGWRNG